MGVNKTSQKPALRIRPSERKFILLVGDVLVGIVSLAIALYIWAKDDAGVVSWNFVLNHPAAWFYFLPLLWLLLLIELYDIRRSSRRDETLRGIAMATGIIGVAYLAIFFLAPPKTLPRLGVASFFIAAAVLTTLWRLVYIRFFTAPLFMRRVLVVGAGRAGSELVSIYKGIWPPPFFVVGYVDDDPDKKDKEIEGYAVLGGGQDLHRLVEQNDVTDIIFAISGEMNPYTFEALLEAEEHGIEVTTMPVVYEQLLGRVPIFLLESDWVLRSFVDSTHISSIYDLTKRLIDILGAVIGLVIMVVLLPVLGLATLMDSGWPIFFTQVRLGKNGEPYNIIKFRTMRQDAEKDGKARMAVENDERVTKIGKLLRKSHLDELPQFFNVLRGEMSMVGPRAERPELIEKLQHKIPFYRARLFVKPGLTGWAQVNYHYASTVEETAVKLEYDLYYIKHRNPMLDFTIILRTISDVIGLRGQ